MFKAQRRAVSFCVPINAVLQAVENRVECVVLIVDALASIWVAQYHDHSSRIVALPSSSLPGYRRYQNHRNRKKPQVTVLQRIFSEVPK